MVCIVCGSETRVVNSRPQKRRNQIWRRRECLGCGMVFTTEESIQYNATWVVRSQRGSLRPFSRDKLLLSLYKSCEHRKTALADAAGLADTIIKKLSLGNSGVIDRQTIIQIAGVALNRFDKAASVYYQAHH